MALQLQFHNCLGNCLAVIFRDKSCLAVGLQIFMCEYDFQVLAGARILIHRYGESEAETSIYCMVSDSMVKIVSALFG